MKSRGHTLSLVGDKDAGEPQKSKSDARKTSEFEEKAEENATEPFGGKTQTVPEDHAAEVHDRREENQRWGQSKKSGVGNESRDNRTQGRGRKLERNTPGTRAGRPVEDRYRSRNKTVILAV